MGAMSLLELPAHALWAGSDCHNAIEQAPEFNAGRLDPFALPEPFVCKVVSIGGAGCRIVFSQMGRLLDAHRVIAIDTNVQALHDAMANEKILLSNDATTLTEGNAAMAEGLAWMARIQIAKALAGAHMVFIVAGMGGRTGSGVAPVVTQIAKQILSKDSMVIAVATTPWPDEGDLKTTVATRALRALHRLADSVIELPNDRLFNCASEAGLPMQVTDLHSYASRAFGEAYAALAGSFLRSSIIAADFDEVRTILASGSMTSVGWGESDSWEPNAARLAARAALNHPQLGETRIAQASGLLVSIATETASFGEVRDVLSEIHQRATGTALVVVATDDFDVRMEGIDVRIIAVK